MVKLKVLVPAITRFVPHTRKEEIAYFLSLQSIAYSYADDKLGVSYYKLKLEIKENGLKITAIHVT